MEKESNDRDILVEGVIVGLGRNLRLGKIQGTQKMTHSIWWDILLSFKARGWSSPKNARLC